MQHLLKKLKFKVSDLFIYGYLILAFIFLVTIGIRAVNGELEFPFYADSDTYIEFYKEKWTINEILQINPNIVGPVIILKALKNNYFLVFLLNAFIILFFFQRLKKLYRLRPEVLLPYLLLSPMLFSSVILINKEIVSLFVIALYFVYYKTRHVSYIILAILFSLLVRWQMVIYVIILTAMTARIPIITRHRGLFVLLFLVFVSVVYAGNVAAFDNVIAVLEVQDENYEEGAGTFKALIAVQNSSPLGYLLVFIPKALFLFIGILSRYAYIFEVKQLYNNVIVFFQCLLHLLVLIAVIRKRIWFNNIFFLAAILYFIIFSLSPIFSPRYLFPGYVMLALALAYHNNLHQTAKLQSRRELPENSLA